MDLTTITTPFGLLDEETQRALRNARNEGADIQMFSGNGWLSPGAVGWGNTTVYRVRPTPKPPAIELPVSWDVLSHHVQFLAADEDGAIWAYDDEPYIERPASWSYSGNECFRIDELFTGIRINVTDWKQSLTKRPE